MSTIHGILDKRFWNLNEIELFLENYTFAVYELNRFGLSPLHRVLKDKKCSIDIVKCLLDYGANPNCVGRGNSDNYPVLISLLHRRDIEIIRLLLEAGAQVDNIYDQEGHSALCIALRYDPSVDLIQMLLEAGCSPKKSSNHVSALHCSMSHPGSKLRADICKLLLKADTSCLLQDGRQSRSFLCRALSWDAEPEVFKVLLEAGCPLNACQEHYSALGCAADQPRILKIDTFQLLLDAGAKVGFVRKNSEDGHQNTLLHKVLETPYDIDIIKLLYDCDNDCFPDGWPTSGLLHSAVKNSLCKPKVLQFLIDQGATASEVVLGITSVHLAVENSWDPAVIEVLLSNGCPVNEVIKVEGVFQSTALTVALESRDLDIIVELLKGGARLAAAANVFEIFQMALEKYDSEPSRENIIFVQILLKYAFLENPKFDIKLLVLGRKHYSSVSKFIHNCMKEIKMLKSTKIYQFIGRYSDYKSKAKGNQLLRVPSINTFSMYFDVICATYGRKAMEMRIQVQPIYCISNGSNLNARKIILNYDIVRKIAGFLVDVDLFSLLVALFHPDKPTCYAKGKKPNFKRCLEESDKPCKRSQMR